MRLLHKLHQSPGLRESHRQGRRRVHRQHARAHRGRRGRVRERDSVGEHASSALRAQPHDGRALAGCRVGVALVKVAAEEDGGGGRAHHARSSRRCG